MFIRGRANLGSAARRTKSGLKTVGSGLETVGSKTKSGLKTVGSGLETVGSKTKSGLKTVGSGLGKVYDAGPSVSDKYDEYKSGKYGKGPIEKGKQVGNAWMNTMELFFKGMGSLGSELGKIFKKILDADFSTDTQKAAKYQQSSGKYDRLFERQKQQELAKHQKHQMIAEQENEERAYKRSQKEKKSERKHELKMAKAGNHSTSYGSDSGSDSGSDYY